MKSESVIVNEKVEELPDSSTTTSDVTPSTTVGISTFDAISVGEHLHPSQELSGNNGSEGELGVSVMAGKTVDELHDQFFPFDEG